MTGFPTPTYLRNFASVLATYQYWPSFHDAPLHSFEHDPVAATLEIRVEVFEGTGEVDAHGYFVTTNHHVVCCRFNDVADLTLVQFDVPNTLFEMIFSPEAVFKATGRFSVQLASVLGGDCAASFSAASGEVVSVTPSDGRRAV